MVKKKRKFKNESQSLKDKLLELSTTKEIDNNTIQLMEKEINQLKVNLFEVESFVIEQHKLGFDKALQQTKSFYKFLLMKETLMSKITFIMVN